MYRLIGKTLWYYPNNGGIGIIIHRNIPANIRTVEDAMAWVEAQEEQHVS